MLKNVLYVNGEDAVYYTNEEEYEADAEMYLDFQVQPSYGRGKPF